MWQLLYLSSSKEKQSIEMTLYFYSGSWNWLESLMTPEIWSLLYVRILKVIVNVVHKREIMFSVIAIKIDMLSKYSRPLIAYNV